jgi:hypothetical protein
MSEGVVQLLAQIQAIVRQRDYRLSNHAEREREADGVTAVQIREAFLSREAAVIEDYPDDPRGHSCLVFGKTKTGDPIHLVCSATSVRPLIVITVYRPNPNEWDDWRKRRQVS